MEDPVQDGRRDDRIAENLVPLAEAAIGGQDQGPFFVSARDELKKQMSAMTIDRDIADLVDNQKLRLAVELQPLLDPILGIGLCQGRDQRHGLVKYVP